MSALSLTRQSLVGDSSHAPASAMLSVDSALAGPAAGITKLSPTNSLRCPRAVKGPAPQNSISVRDLFPAAYARFAAAAGKKEPPPAGNGLPAITTTTTTANHIPLTVTTAPTAVTPPQIVCNSPSNYSPLSSSSNKSSPAAGSPDR